MSPRGKSNSQSMYQTRKNMTSQVSETEEQQEMRLKIIRQ